MTFLLEPAAYDHLLVTNISHFVFCLFLMVYMRCVLENKNVSHSRLVFKNHTNVVLVYLIADMASYVFDKQEFFGARFLNHASMFMSVLFTAYIGYLSNKFFDAVFHIEEKRKIMNRLLFIPTAAVFVLLIVNIFTGWLFIIPEDNVYVRGPLTIVSFILQYFSFAVLTVRALMIKSRIKTLRYLHFRSGFIWTGFLILAFGTAQIVGGGIIAFQCFGITASMFVIFLRFQDDQITNDLLTGLNNRYALDTYIEYKIKRYPEGMYEGRSLWLIMMDINYFKRINDIHGHVEGDRALKVVSDVLKRIGSRYDRDLFIARFGGDEFSLVYETTNERYVQSLCDQIKRNLDEESKNLKYRLNSGVGYVQYTGEDMTLESLYDSADKVLYEDKMREKLDFKL